jgi:glutaredoxin
MKKIKEVNEMNNKRKIEIFSAGCPVCQEAIDLVNKIACPSCEVSIVDMNDPNVATHAKDLGIRSVPSVVIDGKLADCCAGRGPDEATLRTAGLGKPLP